MYTIRYSNICRGAGTILYVGGQTNQNNCWGKSGGTNTNEAFLDFTVGGIISRHHPLLQRP